jgi:hypothetical protein
MPAARVAPKSATSSTPTPSCDRRQSIRLARIDAPPRDTPEGAAGGRFVRKQLAVARTVEPL